MLTRWDPFRDMLSMRRAMDRLFDRALEPSWSESPTWDLALDVVENKDDFLVKASLPGINPDDLDITFTDNVLTIKGEKRQERDEKKDNYHVSERSFGSFERSLSIPETVDDSKIEARFEKGVLHVTVPKKPEAVKTQKKIEIKSA